MLIRKEREKWTDWANNVLARYLVINTNRTLKESFQGYDYVDNVEVRSNFFMPYNLEFRMDA